jgi:hypothetical protein
VPTLASALATTGVGSGGLAVCGAGVSSAAGCPVVAETGVAGSACTSRVGWAGMESTGAGAVCASAGAGVGLGVCVCSVGAVRGAADRVGTACIAAA